MTGQSTIDPAVPVPGRPLDALVVQGNFAAAWADINALYQLIASITGTETTTRVTSGSTYIVAPTDQNLLIVGAGSAPTTIMYTPGTCIKRVFSVLDGTNNAGVNNIVIEPTSGQIAGQSMFSLTVDGMSITVLDDGTNLWLKG